MYNSFPNDFLKGIRIVPHNFDDPENPKHGDYVNLEMKYDLFDQIYSKIKAIELRLLGYDQYIKLKQIKDCGQQLTNLQQFFKNRYVDQQQDKLIKCHDMVIDINGDKEVVYRTEVYQSADDRFYNLVLPYSNPKAMFLFSIQQII